MKSNLFSTLSLRDELLQSISALDYKIMTDIQMQALPPLLKNRDILAQARTGSGKTAVFAIGLLNKLNIQSYFTQAIVVCPTRELSNQVAIEIRKLASTIANTRVVTLCGGKPMGPQLASLKRDPHIVVGTPGRILKHLEIGTLKLNRIETLVLDEADRMLDMGFYDDILNIINVTPLSRQTLLFSATYPEKIKQVSDRVQIKPKDIRIESSHDIPEINQIFFEVEKSHRIKMVYKLISHYELESILIFCNTKLLCQQLVTDLKPYNINALALHGDLEQFERDQILTQFSSKACTVLIATDVAARGIDVTDLSAVINFELSFDPELHIHRIGRTGRAGAKGLALSLFSNNERQRLEAIEEYQGKKININDSDSLSNSLNFQLYPPMVLLFINGGKKEKLRAGDLLGALTANDEINAKQVGKITLFEKFSYVAIDRKVGKLALHKLNNNNIKGRKFRVRIC